MSLRPLVYLPVKSTCSMGRFVSAIRVCDSNRRVRERLWRQFHTWLRDNSVTGSLWANSYPPAGLSPNARPGNGTKLSLLDSLVPHIRQPMVARLEKICPVLPPNVNVLSRRCFFVQRRIPRPFYTEPASDQDLAGEDKQGTSRCHFVRGIGDYDCKSYKVFVNFVISSLLLFPAWFPVVISSKTLKTKRAKVFVFKGSKETGNWETGLQSLR